ncbi:MAG TPA: acetyl-CoA carboxylase biotin carboxyl carrier protein [Firmicutes bacterium]|uniref:Biotin carboxyl carrier protein of acetyl-CoA carboxylase n=1 Tax=Capillibacterium thermochitinicola TaxID=2699427 RepID=A0A8J6LML8_9FIRM|nr:acetyl-CoA carboxylase biotin carboxyl carrier protein [Capillibacterium thermochitinicola]MBA2132903.1 acetyl-CoA carboxylase biotin carboxyl carrier protein [Capillibacterium thermochitinicola]HHW11788.1 acetyl-CoA carboxylase biotin carboxyl carrier protein [Bacillota bacterium]
MNIKEIKELMQMLVETDITELNLESDGTKIMIKKGVPGVVQPVVTVTPATAPAAVAPAPAPVQNAPAPEPAEREQKLGPNQEYVCAEIVGTFYRAPGPGETPFVEVGEMVEPGKTLCIIEAMKVMNEIESPFRGKVVEILVDDAEPVEYGQPLFVIEKI